MVRAGLKKVVKTVKGKKRSTKRTYWVKAAEPKRPSALRSRMGDAAGWLAGSMSNQVAAYAGRKVGRIAGGVVGLHLSPFLTPAAIPVGYMVGGWLGSSVAQLAARPITARVANRAETLVAGGNVRREPGKFWLRGSGVGLPEFARG